jgi:site-specific recombinase XerD
MHLSTVMADYLLACRTLSPKTETWYRQKLNRFVAWCGDNGITELEQLRAVHLREYQDWLLARTVAQLDPSKPQATHPLSPYVVRGSIQVLKGWSRWAVEEEYLDSDPFKRVKKPKQPEKTIQPFTAVQVQALLDACPKSTLGMRDKALVLLLLDTGLRASEVCGLRMAHLHLQEREPWLEVAWVTSKGRKAREVGIGPDTARAVLRYLRLARPHLADAGETAVWVGRAGKALTRNGLDQVLYTLRERAGVEQFTGVRVSAHTFRHTFSTTFLKATGDVYRLSRLCGHSSVAVTEHYLRGFRARDARGEWVSAAQVLLGK